MVTLGRYCKHGERASPDLVPGLVIPAWEGGGLELTDYWMSVVREESECSSRGG